MRRFIRPGQFRTARRHGAGPVWQPRGSAAAAAAS